MKKAITNCVIIIYVAMAIFITICLLSYNDYKVTEFGSRSLIVIDEEQEGFKYKKGDLVILNKDTYDQAKEGDVIFFYESGGVKMAEIKQINVFGNGIKPTFTVDGEYQVVYEDVIGMSNDEKVINKAGTVLQAIESKWGFLFLIVFPSLLAFLHQVFELIMEVSDKK